MPMAESQINPMMRGLRERFGDRSLQPSFSVRFLPEEEAARYSSMFSAPNAAWQTHVARSPVPRG